MPLWENIAHDIAAATGRCGGAESAVPHAGISDAASGCIDRSVAWDAYLDATNFVAANRDAAKLFGINPKCDISTVGIAKFLVDQFGVAEPAKGV